MRAYTHGGWGTKTASQHNNFDWEKLTQIFLVLRTGFEPLIFGSRVDALPTEPPRHPVIGGINVPCMLLTSSPTFHQQRYTFPAFLC